MASNAQVIWQFFASKGLNPVQIAGIMGNLMVESSLDPNAYNSGEGAQGLAQWEGGRLTALQQFAASTGGSATDLNTQLNFLWHELTTSYSGALNDLRNASTASQAAAIWDGEYEISAGTTRTERENNANAVLSSFQSGGVNALAGYSHSTASAGSTPLTGASANPTPTSSDYQTALGDWGAVLNSVPELKNVLNEAVSGGWSTAKFQQAVEQTNWYRTHNATAREQAALSITDPAEYKTKLVQTQRQVQDLAQQMGVILTKDQVASLASQYTLQGWNQQDLAHEIGLAFNPNNPQQGMYGQVATAYSQLQDMYASYGVPMSDAALRDRANQMVSNQQSLDRFKLQAEQAAESLFPSIAEQIKAGSTVKQIADPYIQTMSNLLEIDPNNVGLDDPLIKKALQGTVTTGTNGQTSATSTPLWQFEQTLRADPRWAKTNNARDTMSTALVHIGQDFGFGSLQ